MHGHSAEKTTDQQVISYSCCLLLSYYLIRIASYYLIILIILFLLHSLSSSYRSPVVSREFSLLLTPSRTKQRGKQLKVNYMRCCVHQAQGPWGQKSLRLVWTISFVEKKKYIFPVIEESPQKRLSNSRICKITEKEKKIENVLSGMVQRKVNHHLAKEAKKAT